MRLIAGHGLPIKILTDQDVFVVRLVGLLLHSRLCALRDHSSRCYLRALRASSSCICAKILALCRLQAIADVMTGWRCSRCAERCN